MPGTSQLPNRLKTALENKGITQKDLADKLDISTSAVSQWLSGNKNPNQENITDMAQVLSVSAGWLAYGEGEGPQENLSILRNKYLDQSYWNFRPAPIDGGKDFGNANIWAVPWDIPTLVRETIQNSFDAALEADVGIEVEFTLIKLRGKELKDFQKAIHWDSQNSHIGLHDHIQKSSSNGHKIGKILYEGLDKLKKENELILLRIDDYHTLGLIGDEESGNFESLCRNNLDSNKVDDYAGGSYGLGKAVLWRASRFSTVFFNSKLSETETIDGKKVSDRRVIGRSELAWHEENGNRFAGPGWFGEKKKVDGGYRAESIWENKALTKDLYLERPKPDPGTSILVVGFFDAAADEPVSLLDTAEMLEEAIATYFWPAIVSNMLTVKVRTMIGREEEFESIVDPSKYVPEFIDAYRKNVSHELVDQLENEGDVVRKIVTLNVPRREKKKTHPAIDHEAVLVVRRGSTENHRGNFINYFRGSQMVVLNRDMGELVFGGMPFTAYVACGLASGDSDIHEFGEAFLRTAEPPAHDKWELTPELKDDYAYGAGTRITEFFTRVRTEIIGVIKPIYEGGEQGPKALSRLLRLSSTDKPRKVPKLLVDQDKSYIDDNGSWVVEAEISFPGDKEWIITPVLKFDAETGSGKRVSWTLEGLNNCTVNNNELLISKGVRKARFRGQTDPASHPAPAEDTTVKVILHRIR